MSDFYLKLPAVTSFEQFTRSEIYQPLPDDWVIVVADIKNSTQAIEKGLYKEVNLIGAASITQTMQSQHTQNIPFVFGGDGASICVHREDAKHVARRLGMLQKLAQENYGLTLRVAMIPVTDIRARGVDVLVAKLEITTNKFIAMFRGGGLAMADTLAKQEAANYEIARVDTHLDSLEGLSCRWSPVPSKKGVVVSLLIMTRDSLAMQVYQSLLIEFRKILGRDLAETNPVQNNLVKYKALGQAISDEKKYHASCFSWSFLARVIDICLSVLIFRYGINPVALLFNAKNYKASISQHSDFRKFDDTLRLIMDCSEAEFENIRALLEQGYQDGHLYYGVHTSKEALMTCFVETTQQGEHVHFIDGGDGGLAIASRQLKKQIQMQMQKA